MSLKETFLDERSSDFEGEKMAVSDGKTIAGDAGKKSPGLATAVKKGATWVLASRVLVVFVMFISSIIMARLLEPREFGIFGIAMLFTHLATRFGNLGFGSALIRQKEINVDHVSSVFVLNLVIWPLVAGLLVWLSPYVAWFFGVPAISSVLAVLALTFLAKPFTSVARALMQRQMNFKGPAIANIVSHLVTVSMNILLAWLGFGVWSLVYGELVGVVALLITLMVSAGWVPRFRYSHTAMKELFSFGFKIFLKEILVYSYDKTDVFIVGKLLGPTQLGFYERAFRLMNLSVKELIRKIGPVLFSSFSKLHEDRERFIAAYHKVVLTLSLMVFPVFCGMGLIAPSLIHVLFGEKWMPTVIPLQILCLAGFFRMNLELTGMVLNSMGLVAFEVKRRIMGVLLLIVGCWVGSFWGLPGIATAVTITTFILTAIMMVYLANALGLQIGMLFKPQIPASMASVGMIGIVSIYQVSVEAALGSLSPTMLISSVALGGISYIILVWVLKPAVVKSLWKEFIVDSLYATKKTIVNIKI